MNAPRWHASVPGGATHAYRTEPDGARPVESVCGHVRVHADELQDAPTTIAAARGCSFCRRALGLPRRRGVAA